MKPQVEWEQRDGAADFKAKLLVDELRMLLSQRSRDTKGKKHELIARLQKWAEGDEPDLAKNAKEARSDAQKAQTPPGPVWYC